MLELSDKNIKMVIIMIFYIFKKVNRDMINIKYPNHSSRDENYNI